MCAITENKKIYYEQNIDKQKNSPTKMWKTLKQLIGDRRSSGISRGIEFKGGLCTRQEVAHRFNRFFVESVEEIVNTIGDWGEGGLQLWWKFCN